jgi:hypothetical protein
MAPDERHRRDRPPLFRTTGLSCFVRHETLLRSTEKTPTKPHSSVLGEGFPSATFPRQKPTHHTPLATRHPSPATSCQPTTG